MVIGIPASVARLLRNRRIHGEAGLPARPETAILAAYASDQGPLEEYAPER